MNSLRLTTCEEQAPYSLIDWGSAWQAGSKAQEPCQHDYADSQQYEHSP